MQACRLCGLPDEEHKIMKEREDFHVGPVQKAIFILPYMVWQRYEILWRFQFHAVIGPRLICGAMVWWAGYFIVYLHLEAYDLEGTAFKIEMCCCILSARFHVECDTGLIISYTS